MSNDERQFADVSTPTICQSILLLVTELMQRDMPLRDFDDKERFIQGIQIFGGKPYFLAARENVNE